MFRLAMRVKPAFRFRSGNAYARPGVFGDNDVKRKVGQGPAIRRLSFANRLRFVQVYPLASEVQ